MNCKKILSRCLWMLFTLQFSAAASAQTAGLEADRALNRPASVSMSDAIYRGKSALRVMDSTANGTATIIPLKTENFKDGTITADIAGQPRKGAPESARGFVGIAFRVAGERRYEAIYIRPTNGRSTDQFRRNHTAQYVSMPDFDWERLRAEHPGKYESYADVAPGEWSRIRISVQGGTARLFINGDEQPSLIVNDLKLGAGGSGGVALWVGPHTEAYFANVTVAHRSE